MDDICLQHMNSTGDGVRIGYGHGYWKNLQLAKWLQIGYNPIVLARQILNRRSARCFSSLVTPIATPIAIPSGRFSAGFAVSVANTERPCVMQGRHSAKKQVFWQNGRGH